MDKQTFSSWAWVLVTAIVVSILLAFATPFGSYIHTKTNNAVDAIIEANNSSDIGSLEEVEVETPIETAMCPVIAGKKQAIIPILRAGLGMVGGLLKLMPTAKVGHIGLCRDEETFEPHEYYCKLPTNIDQRKIFVVDPMLATGGSAIAAIDFIKNYGGKDITFLCVIAAPEGLEKLAAAHPDIKIFVGNLDRELNERAYICPGLGDAGDRIFGTR
jgi:uracil phosphoribosyltransferase